MVTSVRLLVVAGADRARASSSNEVPLAGPQSALKSSGQVCPGTLG